MTEAKRPKIKTKTTTKTVLYNTETLYKAQSMVIKILWGIFLADIWG